MIPLYQNPAGFAGRAVPGVRHNAHVPGLVYGFCRTVFLQCFQMRLVHVPSVRVNPQTYIPGCMLPERANLEGIRTAWKFLCFAQNHPVYSGGSTGLTDFFGEIVSPSISQRNCCCVSEHTSRGLRGHWNRLSESLLYSKSQDRKSVV